MENLEKKLTIDEAYDAMIDYLEGYYDRTTHSGEVGSLLSGMYILESDNKSFDSAAQEDWSESVDKILNQKPRVRPYVKSTK